MEKWEIRPPLPQKPLNRSSPKYTWVITSVIPVPMQNFITIRLPPFAPSPNIEICENAYQVTRLVFWIFPDANHCSAKHLPSTSSLPFPSESVVIARSILLLATPCLLAPDTMLYFPRAPSEALMTSLAAIFSPRRQFIAAVSLVVTGN